jgi:transposase
MRLSSISLYRTRNLVERFVNRIKYFRRVFTRCHKLAGSHLVFASLARAFWAVGKGEHGPGRHRA